MVHLLKLIQRVDLALEAIGELEVLIQDWVDGCNHVEQLLHLGWDGLGGAQCYSLASEVCYAAQVLLNMGLIYDYVKKWHLFDELSIVLQDGLWSCNE
jgi:hypothetical protein